MLRPRKPPFARLGLFQGRGGSAAAGGGGAATGTCNGERGNACMRDGELQGDVGRVTEGGRRLPHLLGGSPGDGLGTEELLLVALAEACEGLKVGEEGLVLHLRPR